MAFKTEAIVLHYRTLYGADRMYDVLSPDYGKLHLVARSAAKSSSKMAGFLEPLSHVHVMIGRGRQDHLAGARTIRSNQELRENWFDFILTSSLVELLLTINVSGQSARNEFDLLIRTLDELKIEDNQQKKVIIARIFLWKLLALSGWKPDLERCAISRDPFVADEVYYQSPKGFVGQKHNRNGMKIDQALMVFLSQILEEDDWAPLIATASENGLGAQWLQLSQNYYQDIISRPLQSLKSFNYA